MSLKKELKKLSKKSYPSYITSLSDNDLKLVAHAKRFKERYTADPEFRKSVAIDSRKAAKKYRIDIDPEDIRPIWDEELGLRYSQQNLPMSRLLKLCVNHNKELVAWSTRYRSGDLIQNPNFKNWRQQQITRSNGVLGAHMNAKIVHAPVCFELSSGCSVGCWFCAISAEKFEGAFTYTDENSLLWKEVLEVVYSITGAVAGSGFCYWATDPLDNPDYEKFIEDYRTVMGSLPATNTSKAHKDLDRVKTLISMWKKFGFTCNHLSILTVKTLDKVHDYFTAEELVWTSLNLVNKDSVVKKATAGRAREKLIFLSQNNNSEEKFEYEDVKAELTQGTIACVTGFLFNMYNKTVKLITPCKANDKWPKGYMILEEGTFSSAEDLKILLNSMIENSMPLSIPKTRIVAFRSDLEYKPSIHGFELVSEYQTQKIDNPTYGKEIGELIRQESMTVDEITNIINKLGVTRGEVHASINALFNNGLLRNL